jgi:DNA-binding phage protein
MHIDSFQALLHVELIVKKSASVKMVAAEMGIAPKTLYHKLSGDSPLSFEEALTIVRITQLPALQEFVAEQAGLKVGKLRAVGHE